MGKWWSWVPGLHKTELEKCRLEALSSITGERMYVECMAQRPRPETDSLDVKLRDEVLKKINEIYDTAGQANETDELDDLTEDAELQGLFAAYLCPASEVKIEGDLVIDQIEGWGIPKSSTDTARRLWEEAAKNVKDQPQEARGALYAILAERDAWGEYLEEYNEKTRRTMLVLFLAIVTLLVLAVFALHSAVLFLPFLLCSILATGAAGSCASVMSKMPPLEVSLSGKLDAYGRGVLSRIATGLIATLIGCALLAWIPLSIQGQSFGEIISACTTAPCTTPAATCTAVKMLILLGIPLLLGFSERTLPFFEQRMFGKTGLPPTRSKRRKI